MKNWRYYWRRYLGFLPIQFCMVSAVKPIGEVFLRSGFTGGKLQWTWLPWWKDYCSRKCCDEDLDI